ncbi:phage gene 29 protein family protein [Nocardia otitidiscaviarum]|uniref:phage gene 29 protein family protein n=1 Tax=Nocardia otitidiscaviarum TaxID=1823 RepID=UPI000693B995|nr:DUF2744 domain-containing protein [Nocardia otitidiscaviarum]
MDQDITAPEIDSSPWLKQGEFPTKERCNPNCPEEAFLWTYAGLPGMKGAPLPFPTEYLRMVSRRQWDCGARPMDSVIPPEQTIKYQKPRNTDPHWLTSPGVWVDINDPDRNDFDIKEFVGSLPQDAKRQLAQALGFDAAEAVRDADIVSGYEGTPPERQYGRPSRDGATVSNEPLPFDPVRKTVTEVLAYLRDADPTEQDRVVSIERHLGQARAGILKRYKEVGL